MNFKKSCEKIVFSKHSVQQMFARLINKDDVISSLSDGEIIIEYKNEEPFPCYLILHFVNGRPIHIVVAVDDKNKKCIIVTAYIPDRNIWKDDFRLKR